MNDLQKLVAELLLALQIYFPNARPAAFQPPVVMALSAEELQRRVCKGPCAIWAWYAPDRTIYIDARLNPQRNMFARSIIVHELVHHVQRVEKGPAVGCEDWTAREREAFLVQSAWLKSQGVRPPSFATRLHMLRCQD
jgi:hypothetical protein